VRRVTLLINAREVEVEQTAHTHFPTVQIVVFNVRPEVAVNLGFGAGGHHPKKHMASRHELAALGELGVRCSVEGSGYMEGGGRPGPPQRDQQQTTAAGPSARAREAHQANRDP